MYFIKQTNNHMILKSSN